MKVIGKVIGLHGYALESADLLLGCEFGDAILGLLVLSAPDGLILQDGEKVFLTRGGMLVPFDPETGGWTNLPGPAEPPTRMSAKDWREEILAEGKWFAQFIARYGGENE